MLTVEKAEKIYSELEELLSFNAPSARQYRYAKLANNFKKEMDFIASLAIVMPILPKKLILKNNNKIDFDFAQDLGNLFYSILNEDYKSAQFVFENLPYPIQKLLYFSLSKLLLKRVSEDILLLNMEHFYSLAEILTLVNLPDIIYSYDFNIQALKRDAPEKLIFPLYIYSIPSNLKTKQIVYFVKKKDKYVSNIVSGVIREEIKNFIPFMEYGIIGVVSKARGYKRKYKFVPLYFNENVENVLNIYRGKEDVYNNQLDRIEFKTDFIVKGKLDVISNEEDLKELLKKIKNNKKFILLSSNGLEILQTNIKYDYAKCVDYILNEDYEAIGLVVNYQNEYYKIYFDVMDTTYKDGIEDRFVKIGINYYKDYIINIFYNSEIKKWHKNYDKCVWCNKVKYKHFYEGWCSSCFKKLKSFVEKVENYYEEECEKEIASLIVENCEVLTENGLLKIKPLPYTQLKFNFEDIKFCENEE